MAEEEVQAEDGDEEPKKKSKLPMVLGLILALGGGGGGFFAVYSGVILSSDTAEEVTNAEPEPVEPLEDVSGLSFIPIDPMIVSIGGLSSSDILRFRAQLEVPAEHQAEVETLMPRVVDVLNNYLRALKLEDLEGASALVRLRAQMLRRVQVVVGAGRVRDLLVMEFVLN